MNNYDPDVVKYALCGAFGRRNKPEDRLHQDKDLTTLFGGLPKKSDIINREESVNNSDSEDIALSGSNSNSTKLRMTPDQRLKQIKRQRLNKVFGL